MEFLGVRDAAHRRLGMFASAGGPWLSGAAGVIMGPWGALIMGFFGGIFFEAASVIGLGWNSPFLLAPFLVIAAIAAMARRGMSRAGRQRSDPSRRAGRIIALASILEVAGIPLVALTLANTGHVNLLLPGVAVVVGLHFLPMAYAIPFRPFYVLALFLLMAAVVGMLLPQPEGSVIAGFAAACALWAASGLALTRKPAHLD